MKRCMVTLVTARFTTPKLGGAIVQLVTWLDAVKAKIESLNGSQFCHIIHNYIPFTFSKVMASLAERARVTTLSMFRDHSRRCKLR